MIPTVRPDGLAACMLNGIARLIVEGVPIDQVHFLPLDLAAAPLFAWDRDLKAPAANCP